MVKPSTLAAFLLLTAIANAQTHTPTHTVDGQRVTIDADIVFWSASQNMTGFSLIQGVPLMAPTQAASVDGVSPIIWEIPPGTYQLTAYGFPDDRENPQRTSAVLDIVVNAPTRIEDIRIALTAWLNSLNDVYLARANLQTLNPTRQELIDVINP